MKSISLHRGVLALVIVGSTLALALHASAANTFVTNIIFDDYSDPFDTTGLVGPNPLTLKAYPEPLPAVQRVTTILTSGASAGATRIATLEHLDPTEVPGISKGNSSAMVMPTLLGGSRFLGLGTDTAAPSKLDVSYDFTTMTGGVLDAGTGNTHVILAVFDTDGGDNDVEAFLRFSDLDGTISERSFTSLALNVAEIGDKLIDFTEFADVDFTNLIGMSVVWQNTGIAQYDGRIALVGAGTFGSSSSVPEPSFALSLFFAALAGFCRRKR